MKSLYIMTAFVMITLLGVSTTAHAWGERFLKKREAQEAETAREIHVHVPSTLPPFGSRQLLIVLHGGGGNADRIISGRSESGLNMNAVADKHFFIVAYLNGTKVARLLGSDKKGWNAGNCCGLPSQTKLDDVGYIKNTVAELTTKYGVDPRLIYAIGHSNGAMMAMRMMCETDVFDAIMPISGTLGVSGRCSHANGKYIHAIRGENDKHVPFEGGVGEGPSKTDFTSQSETEKVFKAAGAHYSLQVVPGAGHDFKSMDDAIQKSEGMTIAEKAAQAFALAPLQ